MQTWEHYSSIRNIDGPHTGLPEVNVRALSPESLAQQKQRLASTQYYKPWMYKNISSSLPYVADEATIQQTLERCRGNMDDAVNVLLGEDSESRSVSSTQDSSSAEREPDDDKTSIHRAVMKNKRRSIRLSRHVVRSRSQDSTLGTDSDHSTDRSNSGGGVSTDDVGGSSGPTTRLKLSIQRRDSSNDRETNKTVGKRAGPIRITARDKKELKKQAQKTARKQRQQQAAVDKAVSVPSSKMQAGMALREKTKTASNTPPIENGLRTLFI